MSGFSMLNFVSINESSNRLKLSMESRRPIFAYSLWIPGFTHPDLYYNLETVTVSAQKQGEFRPP